MNDNSIDSLGSSDNLTMNGIKTEDLFIETPVDLEDVDNMPRNLARYARSSYSRKV